MSGDDRDARATFTVAFNELSPRVYAYARRHCTAADAQDVVADTFLIAWRRWGDVPAEPLPWLLVVTRNTISNRRRALHRQGRAVDSAVRLADLAAAGADHHVIERTTMLSALEELTELEREALLLIAWDGLSNGAAAAVAGCSVRAFEVRLSRARARLSRLTTDCLRPAPVDALKGPMT